MPGDPGVTVVTTLVCSFYFACEAAGASSARHSLRPLDYWAKDYAQLGRIPPRDREGTSCRHCEEPTGRANARPMTGSATKQSSFRSVEP
jgi:hypothetical protein